MSATPRLIDALVAAAGILRKWSACCSGMFLSIS